MRNNIFGVDMRDLGFSSIRKPVHRTKTRHRKLRRTRIKNYNINLPERMLRRRLFPEHRYRQHRGHWLGLNMKDLDLPKIDAILQNDATPPAVQKDIIQNSQDAGRYIEELKLIEGNVRYNIEPHSGIRSLEPQQIAQQKEELGRILAEQQRAQAFQQQMQQQEAQRQEFLKQQEQWELARNLVLNNPNMIYAEQPAIRNKALQLRSMGMLSGEEVSQIRSGVQPMQKQVIPNYAQQQVQNKIQTGQTMAKAVINQGESRMNVSRQPSFSAFDWLLNRNKNKNLPIHPAESY